MPRKRIDPTFGLRLKEIRNTAGFTQAKLGELTGLLPNAIARLEGGKREPGWETVQKLAEALGVATDAFKAVKSQPQPSQPVPVQSHATQIEYSSSLPAPEHFNQVANDAAAWLPIYHHWNKLSKSPFHLALDGGGFRSHLYFEVPRYPSVNKLALTSLARPVEVSVVLGAMPTFHVHVSSRGDVRFTKPVRQRIHLTDGGFGRLFPGQVHVTDAEAGKMFIPTDALDHIASPRINIFGGVPRIEMWVDTDNAGEDAGSGSEKTDEPLFSTAATGTNRTKRYTYDANNRLATATPPLDAASELTYPLRVASGDVDGDSTPPLNTRRVEGRIFANVAGNSVKYEYDAAGNLMTREYNTTGICTSRKNKTIVIVLNCSVGDASAEEVTRLLAEIKKTCNYELVDIVSISPR
ncbi:DNA-binding transcriptional repressor PuuR [Gemmata sp. SH-PL17]|uniref:helix-turn-helix domain-containing protein n=1 Tax=Gemmata sp. SH-PL17 TaxID=1630693 RepID=UPI00078BC1F7|nr:helix-turn-helix transcriptional regulator [Gemmata sp. SH-PL17]AMV28799.1 DNA-binding transcriptional repressor PuuR [Gemmata sp. SH-PL17]